jgi:uncharacterized beta barrel domain-containing protein DUF5777
MRVRPTTESLVLLSLLLGTGAVRAQGEADLFPPVGRLLQSRCAMPACHAGPRPAQGMRLEADQVYRSVVNVPARTDRQLLRVAPGDPDRSLLYLKLLPPGEGGYHGPRMPLSMDPLTAEEIASVRAWIESFASALWGRPPEAGGESAIPRTFQDAVLANLPTPDPLGARTMEFQFAHRFKASAPDAGSQGLYGLDSGAWISLDLAYGLTRTLDAGLRRTNLEVDYEAYAKWALLQQSPGAAPVSIAFRGSVANVRAPDRVNRTRWGGQLILARRFGRWISLMAVPTYVTHTNDLDPEDDRGTAAVGAGAELRLGPRRAVTGEWIGQTSGVQAPFQSVSLGFSMATARHVFHLLLTNTQGHHTDLFAPGGDLDVRDGEFRLGFNISRTHTFRTSEPPTPP